jgi:hypothetical protein
MKAYTTKFSTITVLGLLALVMTFMASTICNGQEFGGKGKPDIYGVLPTMSGDKTTSSGAYYGTGEMDDTAVYGFGLRSSTDDRLNLSTDFLLGSTDVTPTQFLPILPISSGIMTQPTASSSGESGVNLLIELIPLWYLFSPDLDGFEIQQTGPPWNWEEVEGYGSVLPSARAGIRINTPIVGIDITGGGGYLWNDAVSAPFYMGNLSANFYVGKHVTIGPHVGFVSFSELEWGGDSDVDFSDSTGLLAGLVLTAGGKTARAYVAVNYLEAEFDVEGVEPGWTANRETLDMSGIGVQLGLLLRF